MLHSHRVCGIVLKSIIPTVSVYFSSTCFLNGPYIWSGTGLSGWWENFKCFAPKCPVSKDNISWKAKRSWEHIPARLARGPWVWKSNKQETHMVYKADWISSFPWALQTSDDLLMTPNFCLVKLKQASHIRPRITYCLLGGVWNFLKCSCWLQDLSSGTACFQRKRKCYSQMHFSLSCCLTDSKQIWTSCVRYI